MDITVLAIGTIRERAIADATSEYVRRLSAYTSVSVRELPEIPYRESFSEAQKEQVKRKEGSGVLASLRHGSYAIALDVAGREFSSEELADYLQSLMVSGTSSFTFAVGGSLGLAQEVLGQTQLRLSLSRMTFPHQIARLILLEQLYRAFKIIRNETYHK